MIDVTPSSDEMVVDNQARYYDNEWVRFTNQLSKNESLGKIAYYAKTCKFTPRAKKKIIMYCYALLGRNLAVTYIKNEHMWNILNADKAVIDSTLKLGLTNFDITDQFVMIMDAISLQFTIMCDQAIGGFERKQINTTKREISREETYPQLNGQSMIQKYLGKGKDDGY